MDSIPYRQQLDEKIQRLERLFDGLPTPGLAVFPSAPEHYRMRAEFRIWHEGDDIHYAMFDPGQKASSATLRRIDHFAPACAAIGALMPRLLAAAAADPVLRQRWYQVEFLATLAGDMLVTMIYHRRLDDVWEAAARKLQVQLGIAIIGRSKGQKRVLKQDHVTERLHVVLAADATADAPPASTGATTSTTTGSTTGGTTGSTPHPAAEFPSRPGTGNSPQSTATRSPDPQDGVPDPQARASAGAAPSGVPDATCGRTFVYRQPEGAFTQPNAHVCERMIGWACAVARDWQAQQGTGIGPDLLELYCGNGNFSIPLAGFFRQVLATEISKTSVAAAQWNIAANGCDNLRIARLSAEEFTEAWLDQREFRRLQQAGIRLDEHDFGTVLVDPPRAGVDDGTLALLQRFERILYISCNPDTLRANLDVLCQTHAITRFALFDQFPFTHHIECGVALERRRDGSTHCATS